MKVFHGLSEVKIAGESCLCMGAFDGVHVGHQALLKRVVSVSRARGLVSLVLTFDPHPEAVISPAGKPPLLTDTEEKLRLFRELGLEIAVVARFDRALANLRARDFVKKVLLKRLHGCYVIVGPESTFGKNGEGSAGLLKAASREMGFEVEVLEEARVQGEAVSSTVVRRAIMAGEMEKAAKMLGRPYRLSGRVIAGSGRGRWLGFPTANLHPPSEKALPPDGVYACLVSVKGRCAHWGRESQEAAEEHVGVVYIGTRPTFGGGERLIEAHICEENLDLSGEELAIGFISQLRGDRTFERAEELVQQMSVDTRRAFEVVGHYFSSR